MIQNKDIIIIGAGPVGLAAAIEIKRRGGHPRIIDQNSGPNPNSRALAINSRTLDLLEPSGVTQNLLAAGRKMKRLVVRKNTTVIAELDITLIPHRYNFLLTLAQEDTEKILAQSLMELGIAVERNLGLVKLEPSPKPRLTLSNGKTTEADIVIGADGAHSIVRKSLGLSFKGETDPDHFGLADVHLTSWPFDDDTVVVTLLENSIAPYLPLGPRFGRMISTVPDCLHHLPPDAGIGKVAWETDFSISYRQAEVYQKGSCFIAGDAAHIHSPVGGRGMNLGIEDACWLAWLLEQGREAEYTALRHPAGKHVLRFTHNFTRFAKARGRLQDIVLQTALPVLSRLPFVQRKLFHLLSAQDTPAPPWLQA